MSELEREVDEAVRQDQAKVLIKKYTPIVAGVLIVVIGGVGGFNFWESRRGAQIGERTAQLIGGIDRMAGQPEQAADILAELDGAWEDDADFRAIASLTEAAARLQAGDRETALRLYDRLADDSDATDYWQEAARLLGVLHRMDASDPEALLAALAPLSTDESPWRHTAWELGGFLLLEQGDSAGAREKFQALADDSVAPASARGRAREMLDALAEGEAES